MDFLHSNMHLRSSLSFYVSITHFLLMLNIIHCLDIPSTCILKEKGKWFQWDKHSILCLPLNADIKTGQMHSTVVGGLWEVNSTRWIWAEVQNSQTSKMMLSWPLIFQSWTQCSLSPEEGKVIAGVRWRRNPLVLGSKKKKGVPWCSEKMGDAHVFFSWAQSLRRPVIVEVLAATVAVVGAPWSLKLWGGIIFSLTRGAEVS